MVDLAINDRPSHPDYKLMYNHASNVPEGGLLIDALSLRFFNLHQYGTLRHLQLMNSVTLR